MPNEFGPNRVPYSAPVFFCIVVLFIAAAPLFWHNVQQGNIESAYENADLYQETFPSFFYGFGRIRAGGLPLWNPTELCGAPFQANPASGLFQPLDMVFLVLPTEQAMAMHGFLSLALMGIFFAVFIRSLGAGYFSASLGAIAYAFSGTAAAAMSRPGMANALVWLPLVFFALHEYGRTLRAGTALLAGTALGLMLIAGANALAATTCCLALLYGLFICVLGDLSSPPAYYFRVQPPFILRRIEGLALIAAAALAVSAIQWLPALFWASSLERPVQDLFSLNIPGTVPDSVRELAAQMLVPKPAALPRLAYVSAFIVLAIPAAAFHDRNRRHVLFFAVASALFLGVTLGFAVHGSWLLSGGWFLFPAIFSLTALAALGFDQLQFAGSSRRNRPRLLTAAILVAAIALFVIMTAEPRGRIAVFVVLMLPTLLLRVRWISWICAAILVLVLFADLASASRNMYRHPFETSPSAYRQYTSSIRTAEEQALDARAVLSTRVLDYGLPANLGMVNPLISLASGLLPMTKDEAIWWRRLGPADLPIVEKENRGIGISPDASQPGLLNFMAARVILTTPDSPFYGGNWARGGPALRDIKTEDPARVLVNEGALPRAFWVPGYYIAEGTANAADLMSASAFDGARECVIDRDSKGLAQLATMLPAQRLGIEQPQPQMPAHMACAITEAKPERVTINVTAPQPGLVVLADTYDSGWKATLDGKSAPTLRANGLFRAIAMPEGAHEIVFRYRPRPFLAGMAISLTFLAISVIAALVRFARG